MAMKAEESIRDDEHQPTAGAQQLKCTLEKNCICLLDVTAKPGFQGLSSLRRLPRAERRIRNDLCKTCLVIQAVSQQEIGLCYCHAAVGAGTLAEGRCQWWLRLARFDSHVRPSLVQYIRRYRPAPCH